MRRLRIVFMGTPEFAVPSLQILVENQFNVVAVITALDKPRGRGQKMLYSPVKSYALEHEIDVLQPPNLKAKSFLTKLRKYEADLQVVVAFRMLPEVVWDMPSIGTFNLHASLLPQYRGAAPINWSIINGEKETGVTTFFIRHEIDTGNIIFQEKESISSDDTAGTLYERLKEKGAELILKTVTAISEGDYPQTPQDMEQLIKQAPKIYKETCEIDWNQPAEDIVNFVRGLSPYPTAWTIIKGKVFKVLKVCMTELEGKSTKVGEWTSDQKNFLQFKAADQLVSIQQLQAPGKKAMDIADFLRGNKL
ncbi:MAG: methionyl-tRNA formyltransferase [Cyclobacteriaceae bacterium]